ncbi:MAG TPA: hypothetical protein VNF99_02970 [Stellaceae bacterium]|nr:hypothetical protein [Stellaceae bacterium]
MATRSKTAGTAADLIPPRPTIRKLRTIAAGCTACPLYARATQTVFGEGPAHAALMLVGETAGDREDLQGWPFVHPSSLLRADDADRAANIARFIADLKTVATLLKRAHAA